MKNTVMPLILLLLIPLGILGQNSPSDEQTNKSPWEFDMAP